MSYGIICRQKTRDGNCKQYANHRFTWPGRDESYICDLCLVKLKGVTEALGMYLQTIPLTKEDHSGPIGMASQSIEETK